MKKISLILLSFLFLIQNSLWAYSSNPRDFVNELVNEAIKTLSDKNLSKDQKSEFIEKVALENVDINALGLYTLGELRKSSNDSRYDLGIKVNRVSFKTFSKSGRTLHENCKGLSLKLELF